MTYKYDVFISYSRDFPFGDWVQDPFYPLFKGYLKGALWREPEIFIDNDIQSGDIWNQKLKDALAYSRCLVGIWSSNYFQSEWCKSECIVMLNRWQRINHELKDKTKGLVVPVSVHDGDSFPSYAKKVQYKDWKLFARLGDGFKKTERWIEFQDQISAWTEDVARAINNAPPWSEEWLSDEWLDAAVSKWINESNDKSDVMPDNSFGAPSLA